MSKDVAVDETKWQAESIVRAGMEKLPEYKKAVRETMKEIKKLQGNVKITPKGK